jgi:hypothetical protein
VVVVGHDAGPVAVVGRLGRGSAVYADRWRTATASLAAADGAVAGSRCSRSPGTRLGDGAIDRLLMTARRPRRRPPDRAAGWGTRVRVARRLVVRQAPGRACHRLRRVPAPQTSSAASGRRRRRPYPGRRRDPPSPGTAAAASPGGCCMDTLAAAAAPCAARSAKRATGRSAAGSTPLTRLSWRGTTAARARPGVATASRWLRRRCCFGRPGGRCAPATQLVADGIDGRCAPAAGQATGGAATVCRPEQRRRHPAGWAVGARRTTRALSWR